MCEGQFKSKSKSKSSLGSVVGASNRSRGWFLVSRLKKERDGYDESERGTDKSEWIKMNDNGVNNE